MRCILIAAIIALALAQYYPSPFFNIIKGGVATSNNALAALSVASLWKGTSVSRSGFRTAGDGGAAVYTWSSSACSLNSGAGDNGSQVKPNAGIGCWIANFAGTQPTPLAWGAVGNGTTDDTIAVQAALAYGGTITLGPHQYFISSPLVATTPVDIEGTLGNTDIYATSCPTTGSAFIATSNINLLTLTGSSATVRNTCFQMGTAAYQRTSGAALTVGATLTTQNGHDVIEHNSVKYPYDGIVIGGATTGATQTNAALVNDNQVLEPTFRGFTNGPLSSVASTNDTSFSNNVVTCLQTTTTPESIGFAIYDGGIRDFSGNESYACNIGTAIIPGTANAAPQVVGGGMFSGILGDTSVTNDLLINSTTPLGVAYYMTFSNFWTGNSLSGKSILIENTGAGAGNVRLISFTGGSIHGGVTANSNPLVDIENDVYGVNFTGNRIIGENGTATQGGILLNSTGIGGTVDTIINGNNFWPGGGFLAYGIKVTGTGDSFVISNNLFQNLRGAEIIYPSGTSPGMRAAISNNSPMANQRPTLAGTPTIDLLDYQSVSISGIASTTISNLKSGYTGRSVFVVPIGVATTYATSGTAGQTMCASYTTNIGIPFTLFFDPARLCWWAK